MEGQDEKVSIFLFLSWDNHMTLHSSACGGEVEEPGPDIGEMYTFDFVL